MIYNKRLCIIFMGFVHSDEFKMDKFDGINEGKLLSLMIS